MPDNETKLSSTTTALNLRQHLEQLATHLPDLADTTHPLGQLWQAIHQDLESLTQENRLQALVSETMTDLSEITDTIAGVEHLAQTITHLLQKRFGFHYVGIFLLDETGEQTKQQASVSRYPIADTKFSLPIDPETTIGRATQTHQTIVTVTTEETAAQHSAYVDPPPTPFIEIVAPLASRGETLGTLILLGTTPTNLQVGQVWSDLLQPIATQIANVLQTAQLFATIDRQLEQMAALYHISLQMGGHFQVDLQLDDHHLDFSTILDDVAQLSLQLANADASLVRLMVPPDLQHASITKVASSQSYPIESSQLQETEASLSRKVARSKQVVLANNWPQHPLAEAYPVMTLSGHEILAIMNVPLVLQNKTIGTIAVYSFTKPQAFNESDSHIVSLLASQAAIAIENTHLFNQAENTSRFLKAIIEHIPDPIFIKNRNHTWIEMNQANAEVIGQPYEQLIGKTDHDFFPQELADEFYERDDKVFKTNQSLTVEDKTVWADGQEHVAYTRLIPVPSKAEHPDYLLGITHDITERKTRELERERLLSEMAMLYNGSQAIANALSEKQIFDALFQQIRTQDPTEILTYYFRHVDGEPIWAELAAHWQIEAPRQLKSSLTTENHIYLPDSPQTEWLTTQEPVFIENMTTAKGMEIIMSEQCSHRHVQSLAILPLRTTSQAIGVTLICFTEPYTFTTTIKRFWRAMVDQAAILLANRQLIQGVTSRAMQIETAAEVARTASSILDVQQLLNAAVQLIRDRFDLYYVGVFLVDDQNEWAILRAGTGEAGRIQLADNHRLKIGGESMIGWALANMKGRIALDVGKEAVHFQNPYLPETRSEIALPLIYRGQAIGALTVQSTEPAAFSQQDTIFLQTMADQLANAIENARLFEQAQQEIAERERAQQEAQQRNEALAAVNRVAQAATTSLDLKVILREILQEVTHIFGIGSSGVALLNEDRTSSQIVATYSSDESLPDETGTLIPMENNPSSQKVLETGKTLVVPNAQTNPLTQPVHDLMRRRGIHAIMITPLKVRDKVIGTLGIDATQPDRTFTPTEVELAETIAGQIAGAVETARLFEQMQRALEEQRRSEAALRQAEEKYRSIVQNSLEGIFQTTPDGHYLSVNPALARLYGYNTPEDLVTELTDIGHQLYVDPDRRNVFMRLMDEQDEVTAFESRIYRRDGNIIWISENARAVRDGEGQLLYYEGTVTDITQNKEAEFALKESEQRYRSLYNHTPVMMHSINQEGYLVNVNDYWLATLGYERDEVIGQRSTDYLTPDSQRHAQEVVLPEFFRKGFINNAEYQMVKKNGEVIDVLISAIAQYNETGEFTNTLAFIVDVTKRKQIEVNLRQALERTQSLYRISEALTTTIDQRVMFETVLGEYLDLLGLKRGGIMLLNERTGNNELRALYVDGKAVEPDFVLSPTEDIVAQHLSENPVPFVIENVHTHPATQGQTIFFGHTQSMLLIPLIVRGQVVGRIGADSPEAGSHFSQAVIETGQAIADQLGIWLENRQLLEETQKRSILLQTGAEVSRTASSILDVDELITRSVNLIRNKFDFYYVGLFLVDAEGEWAVLRAGTGEAGRIQLQKKHRLKIGGESMIGWCVAHGEARIALDVGEEAVHFQNPDLPETHSEMALPLISRDETLGALTVQSIEQNAFSDEDITLLQTMADQLANAIRNAHFFEEVKQAQEEAEERLQETIALQQLSQGLSGTLRVDEILDIFFKASMRVLEFEYILYSQSDGQRVRAIDGRGISDHHLRQTVRTLDSDDIMADIIRTGNTEIITGWDDRFNKELYDAEGHADWTRIFIPVTLRQENIGLVEAGFKHKRREIGETQVRLLRAFIDQTVLALDNAQRYEASQRIARREALIKEITTKVRASTDIDTIMRTTVREIQAAVPGKQAYINLIPPKNGEAHDAE